MEYTKIIKVLEEAILSTDLAVYFGYVLFLLYIIWTDLVTVVVELLGKRNIYSTLSTKVTVVERLCI